MIEHQREAVFHSEGVLADANWAMNDEHAMRLASENKIANLEEELYRQRQRSHGEDLDHMHRGRHQLEPGSLWHRHRPKMPELV